MKTYKKNELKDIFQKELKNITVSNELKNKTVDNIRKQHTTPIYWLRNCAAVLLVSCICLSLYLQQNVFFEKKNITQESVTQDIELGQKETFLQKSSLEEKKIRSSLPKDTNSILQQKSILTETVESSNAENAIVEYGLGNTMLNDSLSSDTASFFSTTVTEDYSSEDSIKKIQIGDTEEMLLQSYPNLEQLENTYRFITEDQIIIYQIENGIITNISTISNH